MINILNEKDAFFVYEKYLKQCRYNKKETLIAMEKDRVLPYFFMKYHLTYVEFINKFNISEETYLESNCPTWIDQTIFNTKPIPKSKCPLKINKTTDTTNSTTLK